MKQHKIGIIGCGWHADFYIQAVKELGDRATVEWVADPSEAQAKRAAELADAKALDHYHSGLKDVDCVFVLVPHTFHHPVALDCLRAECDVLIEKPLATSIEQANEMIEVAEGAKRKLMVSYPHRYHNSFKTFKKTIDDEEFGKLAMLDGLMDENLQWYTLGWIAEQAVQGGVFHSSSPYMLDVMRWIAGDVRSMYMTGIRSNVQLVGEDTAAAIIKFENGVIGVTRNLCTSPRSKIWFTMNAVCENGHLTLTTSPEGDLMAEAADCKWQTRIVSTTSEGEKVVLESTDGLNVGPVLTHFLDCIENDTVPDTDGRQARDLMKLVSRTYEKATIQQMNP